MKKIILGICLLANLTYGYEKDGFKTTYTTNDYSNTIAIKSSDDDYIYTEDFFKQDVKLNMFSSNKMVNIQFNKEGVPFYELISDKEEVIGIAFLKTDIEGNVSVLTSVYDFENYQKAKDFFDNNFEDIKKEFSIIIKK